MKWLIFVGILCLPSLVVLAQHDHAFGDQQSCSHKSAFAKSINFTEVFSFNTYDLVYQKAEWHVDPKIHYISGDVLFVVKALQQNLGKLTLTLSNQLQIDSVYSGTQSLSFTHKDDFIEIDLPHNLALHAIDSFHIAYQGMPKEAVHGGFNTVERDTGVWELFTLSEPYGSKEWWPCKQSLQDKVDSIDIIVHCPEAYKTASNGILVQNYTHSGIRTMHWRHRYPITTYLVGIAVTNYATYSDYWHYSSSDSMEILNYVYPDEIEEAQERSPITESFLGLFSALFTQYPFIQEKYGHAQFSWPGGMEHQTMSFMYNFGFELVSHELAHQWFGNYVTLNSWHDIWLNEGFATYCTLLAYEYLNPYWLKRFREVRLEKILREPGGSVYVADTTSVERIFSGRLSYSKGAYLLQMLRWELGDDAFFNGITNYLKDAQNAYGFVSQNSLVNHLELSGDTVLTDFFDQWYYKEGYPIYDLKWDQNNDSLNVRIAQTTSHASVSCFKTTLPLGVYSNSSREIIRLTNRTNSSEYTLFHPEKIDSVILDPDLMLVAKTYNAHTNSPDRILHQLQLYPNPTKDYITVKSNTSYPISNMLTYSIYSMNGSLLLQGTLNQDCTIKLSMLEPGCYILHLQESQYSLKQKLVIEH